jgi:hypothetical protein
MGKHPGETASDIIERLRAKLKRAAGKLACVNGHDKCYLGPDPNCPNCERRRRKKDAPRQGATR